MQLLCLFKSYHQISCPSFVAYVVAKYQSLLGPNILLENRVLRRVFGPKRDEETGEWRKVHNEELSLLNSSSNIVRVIKSRRMRWPGM